ncbi:MAG: MauE/DoxX family redox-associated membrane protein [Actinomycetota bacterium]
MPIARLALALLLLSMAVGQTVSVGAFVDALESYRLGGREAGVVAAAAFIASEAAAGVGLLMPWPRLRVWAARVGLGVAGVWAALAAQAFVRTLAIPNCGCFGRYLGQRLSWWVLVQDAYFVLLAVLALRSARRDVPVAGGTASGVPARGGRRVPVVGHRRRKAQVTARRQPRSTATRVCPDRRPSHGAGACSGVEKTSTVAWWTRAGS